MDNDPALGNYIYIYILGPNAKGQFINRRSVWLVRWESWIVEWLWSGRCLEGVQYRTIRIISILRSISHFHIISFSLSFGFNLCRRTRLLLPWHGRLLYGGYRGIILSQIIIIVMSISSLLRIKCKAIEIRQLRTNVV